MMRRQYFLDSNFVVALLDTADFHHKRALDLMMRIEAEEYEIFFSDVIINEVSSVLAKRCESKKQPEQFNIFLTNFRQNIQNEPILCLYELVPQNYRKIFNLMARYDGVLNFHDCLIALFLANLPRVSFVTFDGDFTLLKNLNILS